jgi:Abortive infection C-terminus
MRLGEGAISTLVKIAYDTGMSSANLISFFNSFGLHHPLVHTLDSKRRFASQAWRELNGRPEVSEAINQILHPHHWPDEDERERQIATLARSVRVDGFDLVREGDGIALVRRGGTAATGVLNHLRNHGERLNHTNVLTRIHQIERTCDASPGDAIGAAKELIEAVTKDVIERSGETYDRKASPSALVRQALKCLKLAPDDIPDSARGVDAIRATLTALANIAHQLDELRGLYGSGHGKPSSSKGLESRHARLAVGAAGTLCLFLIETFRRE